MALTEVDFLYPRIIMPQGGLVTAATNIAINGTSDAQVWICQAEESITITAVGFHVTTRTGSPGNTATGLRVGITYIDATTGFPTTSPTPTWADATFSGAAGTAYQDFNATSGITINQNLIATLTTAVTISRGTVFGICADPLAGTWDTSNFINIRSGFVSTYPSYNLPYCGGITLSTYADNTVDCPTFLYRSSTKTYGQPYETVTSLNNSNASTPDEYGMYFRMPTGSCSTYQISGLRLGCLVAANFDVLLYDTNGTTVLASVTADVDQQNQAVHGAYNYLFTGATLPTLTAGSYYRLVVRPSTTTAMGNVQYFTFRTDADKTAILGNAADVQYTSRTDAGAWTQDTNRLFAMQAIVVALDAGTSTGGMKVHPGLSGGING